MTDKTSFLYEPIDLCACFDPVFDPPAEQLTELVQIVRTVQKSPKCRILGFSRSGGALAEPLLLSFGFARGYKTGCIGRSSRWPRRM